MTYFEVVVRLGPREAREAIDAVLDSQGFDVVWEDATTAYAISSSLFRLIFFGWLSRLHVMVAIDPRDDGLTAVRVEKGHNSWLWFLDLDSLWSRNRVFDGLRHATLYGLSRVGVLAHESSG